MVYASRINHQVDTSSRNNELTAVLGIANMFIPAIRTGGSAEEFRSENRLQPMKKGTVDLDNQQEINSCPTRYG